MYGKLSSKPDKTELFLWQSKWLKSWRERFVVLKGHHLFCSKEDDVTAHDVIDLARCSRILMVPGLYKQQSGIEILTIDNKRWLLWSDEMAVLDDWIEAMVVKAVAMYVQTRQNDVNVARNIVGKMQPEHAAYTSAIASAHDKDKEARAEGLLRSAGYVSALRERDGRTATQNDSFDSDVESLTYLILLETTVRHTVAKNKLSN
jgi:nucleoside diphosphate kinase